jgi:hypothetical protein
MRRDDAAMALGCVRVTNGRSVERHAHANGGDGRCEGAAAITKPSAVEAAHSPSEARHAIGVKKCRSAENRPTRDGLLRSPIVANFTTLKQYYTWAI